MKFLNRIRLYLKWKDFLKMPFPEACIDEEPADVCLASVDTFAAGSISVYLQRGKLDVKRVEILRSCLNDLQIALPSLEGYSKDYFQELSRIGFEVIKNTDRGRS